MVTQMALVAWATGLAYEDWQRRRLPNALLLAGFFIGIVHWLAYGTMPSGVSLGEGGLTAVTGMAVLLPLYAAGWMGAGDVKFCATIGWLLGMKYTLTIFLAASIVAGTLALLLLVPSAQVLLSGSAVQERLRSRVPFGSSLSLAMIATTIGWLDPDWLEIW